MPDALIGSCIIPGPVLGSGIEGAPLGEPVLQLHLVITQQPSAVATSGALLAQQPIVAAQFGGITDTNFNGTVSLTVQQVTGGPTTSNVGSQAAVSGVATFAGIRLTTAGTCTLLFTAPGCTPIVSTLITVS